MQEFKKNLLLLLLITTVMEVPINALDCSKDEPKKYCRNVIEYGEKYCASVMKCCGKEYKEDASGSTMAFAWKAGKVALYTAGASAAVIGTTAVVVPALGFGAAGVAAGSVAAGIQSSVLGGSIASGGLFATLQSIGAAGIPAAIKALIIGTSGAASTYSVFDGEECKNKK